MNKKITTLEILKNRLTGLVLKSSRKGHSPKMRILPQPVGRRVQAVDSLHCQKCREGKVKKEGQASWPNLIPTDSGSVDPDVVQDQQVAAVPASCGQEAALKEATGNE